MSKTSSFGGLTAGRPSNQTTKDRLLASIADTPTMKRVNFECTEDRHAKLKINAAKAGMTVKDFLTAYIDSLPG